MSSNTGGCISRFGGFGDNLIVSSVFPALKAKYGRLEVITKEPCSVVFQGNPFVDKIINKDDKEIPSETINQWQDWFVQRSREYEFFKHLTHSCEMRHAVFYGQPSFFWSDKARRAMYGGSYLETVHDICDVPYDPIGTRFYPFPEEIERAERDKAEKLLKDRGGPLIGWVCSGTRIDKRHPRAGYAIARMIRELDATVALFGGWQKDRYIAEEIEGQVKHSNGSIYGDIPGLVTCISPSGENDTWPIRRGYAQLQQCDLVITPDTSCWWAVHSCPMPKILMVSHASAENIGKHGVNTTILHADPVRVDCWPCHRLHNNHEHCRKNEDVDAAACISDVSVDIIVQAAAAALGAGVTATTIAPDPLPDHSSLIEWQAAAQ